MSAPRGWNMLRLAPDPATIEPTHDDLLALADAVREAAGPLPAPSPTAPPALRLVKSDPDALTPTSSEAPSMHPRLAAGGQGV